MEKFRKSGKKSTLECKKFYNIFQNEILVKILWKNPNRIWDETRQILG